MTKRWFGFPDIHIPDQDQNAVNVALKAQKYFQPDYTVIGNDLVNCTPFTRWPISTISESTANDWQADEINPANSFIDEVQKNTKETYFLPGNHDNWVERWCARTGLAGQAVYNMISLRRNISSGRSNFHYITKGYVKLHRNLYCVHGWSYAKHASAKHLELTKSKSVIFNHTHRMQTSYGRDPWTQKAMFAMSAGCLCNQQPMYMHDGKPTEWVHGFWVAFIGTKSYTVYPVLIEDNCAIMPDGKEIKC